MCPENKSLSPVQSYIRYISYAHSESTVERSVRMSHGLEVLLDI